MKVKKLSKAIVCSMCLLMLLPVQANASYLWKHSSSTYVESVHIGYWSDEYTGTTSVKGTDRLGKSDGTWSFAWTKITYDVQGDVTTWTSNSTSSNDSVRRYKTQIVYDKWNNSSKTTVNYNYGLRYVSGALPYNDPPDEYTE